MLEAVFKSGGQGITEVAWGEWSCKFLEERAMNFDIPADLKAYLDELDAFIETEIKPLEQSNDNIRFFDHRREDARTDWERGGLPNEAWEKLLGEARRRADAAPRVGRAVPMRRRRGRAGAGAQPNPLPELLT